MPIHYSIRPADPEGHYFEVSCTVAAPAADGQPYVKE